MNNGRIALWRYKRSPRSYAGYHLTADDFGCAQVLSFLRSPAPHRAAEFELAEVTPQLLAVPNNGDHAVAFQNLRIEITATGDGLAIVEKHPRCTISLSPAGLAAFQKGVEDVAAGTRDYCIGPEGNEIWFWWWPTRA